MSFHIPVCTECCLKTSWLLSLKLNIIKCSILWIKLGKPLELWQAARLLFPSPRVLLSPILEQNSCASMQICFRINKLQQYQFLQKCVCSRGIFLTLLSFLVLLTELWHSLASSKHALSIFTFCTSFFPLMQWKVRFSDQGQSLYPDVRIVVWWWMALWEAVSLKEVVCEGLSGAPGGFWSLWGWCTGKLTCVQPC